LAFEAQLELASARVHRHDLRGVGRTFRDYGKGDPCDMRRLCGNALSDDFELIHGRKKPAETGFEQQPAAL